MIMLMSYIQNPNQVRLGVATVRYHDLILNMDVVLHTKFMKIWFRMPERWNRQKKEVYATWPNNEISQEFQNTLVDQIAQKFGLTPEKGLDAHKASMKEFKKNARHNSMKKLP